MKIRFHVFAGLSLLSLTAGAQRLQADYITWPDGHKLGEDVTRWNGSQLMEDENFFISRVKIKPYIHRNTVTQVFEEINDDNDKKCLFWVPVGYADLDGVHTDALPNSRAYLVHIACDGNVVRTVKVVKN